MPVKREGRFVTTSPAELNRWLGRESGEPVHVATPLIGHISRLEEVAERVSSAMTTTIEL
jgi:hypothetical protein